MKLAILSDTHYISRRMILDKNNTKMLLEPTVSEQAVIQASENVDVLLITGDLTDDGDRYSHEDFSAFLKTIKAKGKRIYVIFATHDYHHNRAYVCKYGCGNYGDNEKWNLPYFNPDDLNEYENKPQLVEALSPDEIWNMYKEFGPDEAYSVYEPGYSYCIDLDEKTRVLMLNDIFRNEEALKDNSASYSPNCFRWIKQMYDEAERDGKYIFACSHHPMVPPSPAYRIGAGISNRDMKSPYTGHTLADIGINLVFTGHTHFCDVGYLQSEKFNHMYDITVPSVRFYPPAYRNIEIDTEKHTVKYDCTLIQSNDEINIDDESLCEYYHKKLYKDYYDIVMNFNENVRKILDKLCVKDIYFLVKGKAKLKQSEYENIKNLKVFDLIIESAFNMVRGDGKNIPDTPEYKILMSLSAKIDSIIDTQPFVDIKKKYLHGYSVSQIMEPLMFNKSIPDREGEIDYTKKTEITYGENPYKSYAGDVVMALIYGLCVLLSVFSPFVAVVGIPLLTVNKKLKRKKSQDKPNYIY